MYFTFVLFVKENTIEFSEILGFLIGLTPLPPNQHIFLVSKFFNLVIVIGGKMEKIVTKNVNNKKKLAKQLGLEI